MASLGASSFHVRLLRCGACLATCGEVFDFSKRYLSYLCLHLAWNIRSGFNEHVQS